MAKNPGSKFEHWVLNQLKSLYEDAHRRKGSGSVHGLGDVTAGPYEIECKDNPDQQSISVTEKDWKRTVKAARDAGLKIPIFINKNRNGEFVTMRWTDWLNMVEAVALQEGPEE